ncbi:hypothetical protein [Aeromonas sobria]|uniref:hypothetical protein n=1 Tax=Aeromonas sobria TaxID=646 RepID=UPI003CFFFAB0
MSSQLKRMTFSIYMDPGALESDRYAVGVLQNWYQRARKIQDGSEEFDFSKSRFHKDIYLSGMFLYVLAPNLCKAIANALGPEQVSLTTLRHAFASCGFHLGEGASPGATDSLIDEIVARLAPQLGQDNSARMVEEIVSRLGEQQPTELWDELRQGLPAPLDHDLLADAIVGRARSGAPCRQPATALPPTGGAIAAYPRAAPADPATGQRPRPSGGPADEAEPLIEDLSSQVANMKKVKAKGIF